MLCKDRGIDLKIILLIDESCLGNYQQYVNCYRYLYLFYQNLHIYSMLIISTHYIL